MDEPGQELSRNALSEEGDRPGNDLVCGAIVGDGPQVLPKTGLKLAPPPGTHYEVCSKQDMAACSADPTKNVLMHASDGR